MNENTSTNKITQFTSLLMNTIPVFLAFLMPVFFLPITLEFYEFNKLTLMVISTLLLLVTWIVKMLADRKVSIVKSKLDVAMLLFLAVYILAAVFSVDKISSIFGSQGRWFPSLFGIAALFAMYYAIASNTNGVKVAKNAILALVAGATISSFVALLNYFGVPFGSAQFLRNPGFTLTGSITMTANLAALATILSLSFINFTNIKPLKMALTLAAILNLAAVLFLSVTGAYVVLVVGALMLLILTPVKTITDNKLFHLITAGATAAMVLLLVIPATGGAITNDAYPDPVQLAPRESWRISSSTIRDFPILGTGPSTFYLNYPRYRSINQNYTEQWGLRYDKPFNEPLNVLSNLGVTGILVYAFFLLSVIRMALRNEDSTGLLAMISIAIISALTMQMFTYATVLNAFLLFLFLALNTSALAQLGSNKAKRVSLSLASVNQTMSLMSDDDNKSGSQNETFQYIGALLLLAAVVAGTYYSYRTYMPEFYMRQAVRAAAENDGGETYRYQNLAISIQPQRDTYRNALANTNILLANSIASGENLTEQDRVNIQNLIGQAISNVRLSTETLNPLNVNGWETRAFVYRSIRGVAEDAALWEVRAYNAASQLDPTNPRLRVSAGGVHFAQEDYLTAANLFRQAANLKNDYANAHYNLGYAFLELDDLANARREFLIVQALVDAESADAERIAADLAELESRIEAVAGASAQAGQPTVGQLEAQSAETPAPEAQEPLTQPGQAEEAIPAEAVNEDIDTTGPAVEDDQEPTGPGGP